jgi:biopolymer transport protein ExbB
MNFAGWLARSDLVTALVALVLLAMSVASWVVIVWKSWLLKHASAGLARATAAFWQAASLEAAQPVVQTLDQGGLLVPLLHAAGAAPEGPLAASGERSQQLTRKLRDALHSVVRTLQTGQVLLATVGSTAPFVGLLGTVWGIYHALLGMAAEAQVSVDKIAGPVGESLIMTASGLAVAIPAVLAYNVLGRRVAMLEAELEGFALDLRELLLSGSPPAH